MDIPADILTVLTCSQCEAMLSRGPIFQQHDGAAVCGRCVSPERPATRNFIYEASVKLLRFPCKNKELGCDKTVSFVEEQQEIPHEQGCLFRQYLCPVVPAGQCDWLGRRRDLFAHCTTQHPEKVFRNAGQFCHDISKSSVQTYVLSVFHFLFLVHTKVCVTTGKIFHAVRCLGDANNASKFRFSVDVKRGSGCITKSVPVAQQGCLAIQEHISMVFNINSLLDVLDGFKGTTFTLTVWDTAGCKKCNVELWKYFYPNKDWWLCNRCAPVRQLCRNEKKGCPYRDVDVKCTKHEKFFCPYLTQCPICNKGIQENMLGAHYNSEHSEVIYASGTVWQCSPCWGKFYLISTDLGLIRCRVFCKTSHLELYIMSPSLSEELNEVYCEVQVTDSIIKNTRTYQLEVGYSNKQDWHFKLANSDFPANSGQWEVSVAIKRVEPQ